jgi:phosphoglycolate phosphatase-like HAD superfamily hydrolase
VKENNNSVIIFDFDGTIVDSLLMTFNVAYRIAHHQTPPKEDISRLRAMSAFQLLREINVPWWRAFFLVSRVRLMMRTKIDDVEIVSGIDEAIKSLHKKHKLFILSSNSTTTIQTFLRRYDLDSYFTGIYGGASVFGKASKLEHLIRRNDLDAHQTWYVGDEKMDVSAAKRVGLKSVAVAWGFSNIHVLENCHPTALVFDTDELVALFGKQ